METKTYSESTLNVLYWWYILSSRYCWSWRKAQIAEEFFDITVNMPSLFSLHSSFSMASSVEWLISMMLMRCVGVLYGHWEGLTPALTRGPISLDRTVSDSLASLPRQRGSAFVFIKGQMSAYICGEVSWHDGLQRTPADGVCEQKGCACVTTSELRSPELTRSLISRARSWNLSGERVMWGWAVRARVDMRN